MNESPDIYSPTTTINGTSFNSDNVVIGFVRPPPPPPVQISCPKCARPFKTEQGKRRHLKEYHR